MIDDCLLVDGAAMGGEHFLHLPDLGRVALPMAHHIAGGKMDIGAALGNGDIVRRDDTIGGGVDGQIAMGVGEVFVIENTAELIVVEKDFPIEIGIGSTKGKPIGGEMLEVGFHIFGIEDGIMLEVGLAEIAGVVKHEHTIGARGSGQRELMQADGGAEDERGVDLMGRLEEVEVLLLGGGSPIAVELHFGIMEAMGAGHLGDALQGVGCHNPDIDRGTEEGEVDEDGGNDGERGGDGVGEGDGGVGDGALRRWDDIEKAEIEFLDMLMAKPLTLRWGELEGGFPIIDPWGGIGHTSPMAA